MATTPTATSVPTVASVLTKMPTTPAAVGGVKYDPLGLGNILANIQKTSDSSHADTMKNMANLSKLISTLNVGGVSSNRTPVGGSVSGGGVVARPVKVSGNVKSWVDTALKILGLPKSFESGVENMIQHESGGNPNSINNWDINAKEGHPSQGLMQTIPGTFKEYALPGYNSNILDPVSNIIAGVRYAQKNYGNNMILAGGRHDAQGRYIGY